MGVQEGFKAEVKQQGLRVGGGSGPSLAAGGIPYFLVDFKTDFPEPIYGVRIERREGRWERRGEKLIHPLVQTCD